MATPLAATARISMHYDQSGIEHVMRHYVRATGGVVVIDGTIIYRDATDHDWKDAAQGLYDALRSSLAVAAPTILFEERSLSIWLPVDSYTPTGTVTGGAAPARQATLVSRATDATKVKTVLMESNAGNLPFHTNSATVAVTYLPFTQHWQVVGAGADDPYQWVVGRSEAYLAISPFVGATTDLNDKLRRARGLV